MRAGIPTARHASTSSTERPVHEARLYATASRGAVMCGESFSSYCTSRWSQMCALSARAASTVELVWRTSGMNAWWNSGRQLSRASLSTA